MMTPARMKNGIASKGERFQARYKVLQDECRGHTVAHKEKIDHGSADQRKPDRYIEKKKDKDDYKRRDIHALPPFSPMISWKVLAIFKTP